jgi:hypothetical protein
VAANSSSSSTMVATNLWHLGWVHMVGATPAAGSWQWQPSPRVGLLPHKWQYPNSLCFYTAFCLFECMHGGVFVFYFIGGIFGTAGLWIEIFWWV